MNYLVRFLIFIGYAIGAIGILAGFFQLDWRLYHDISKGYEFINLATDQIELNLTMIGRELSPDILQSLDTETLDILLSNWSTLAIYGLLILAFIHSLSAIGAFVVLLTGRPLYPHGSLGAIFAIFSIIVLIILQIALPLWIMREFYNEFLLGQTLGNGFYVTVGGVIVGGLVSPLVELIRLFIQHPALSPQKQARMIKQSPFDESEVGIGYFDDSVKKRKQTGVHINQDYHNYSE
jgi:hypothetical protein